MQTGALIVAAGKSSRMGDFKPMLQLGSISIAQRVINNFRQAGISKVVVVTGYHADVLECHLASNNVVFLRNENYANTHMFDSVRIGLEYLKDKVDTVLFTFIKRVGITLIIRSREQKLLLHLVFAFRRQFIRFFALLKVILQW